MAQILGPTTVPVQTTASYTVTEGSEYSWSVEKGDILAGQNEETITVLWTTGGQGTVACLLLNAAEVR
jgi:hypothetical protein